VTSWRTRLLDAVREFHPGRRRVWTGERLYLEVRLPEGADLRRRFVEALQRELEAEPGVAWARLNPALSRVVVAAAPLRGPLSREHLGTIVTRVERTHGASPPNWRGRKVFPGDTEPILRFAVETAADAAAFGSGLAMRLLGVPTVSAELGLAASLSLLEFVPSLREQIEERIGPANTDLAINAANAFTQALVQGSSGPVVDAAKRLLRLREHAAHADAWAELEPELGATPEAHGEVDLLEGDESRPGTLREGPIETYTSRVLAATAGAFGFSFAANRDLTRSTASVFGGVPKPARHGREAFAADLGHRLARRGVLVMDPSALRRLDRIDCVLVPAALLRPRGVRVEAIVAIDGFNERDARRNTMRMLDVSAPERVQLRDDGKWWLGPHEQLELELVPELAARADALVEPGGRVLVLRHREQPVALVSLIPMPDPTGEAFAAAVRRAGLLLVCAGERPSERGWVEADRYVAGDGQTLHSLRTLQLDGRGVALIDDRPGPGFGVADVGIGLYSGEGTPPWGACFVCREGLADAALLVEAIAAARSASQQSVYLAMIEAASGLILSLGGIRSRTVRRVMLASNAASVLAMANGIRLARGVQPVAGASRGDATPWHALEVDEVLERLHGSSEGLDRATAAARQRPRPPEPSALSRLGEMMLEELANPLAPVLAAGAGLSALTGSVVDAGLITSVVALNAGLGAVQRERTDRALAELDASEGELARVRRNGHVLEIDPEEVVTGDLLVLAAGDSVVADARIVSARGLELDESSLTGESLPVAKRPAPSFAHAVADRTSMVFAGTTVAAGECTAVVTAVGEQTESRRASGARRESGETGVEARLESLTNFTAPIAALSGAALMAAGVSKGQPTAEVISSGVSLAVAAVPEGLPLLATMAQLAAARRLSQRGAMVRNPRAVEALGRADILCADKTGTLTEGRIQLRVIADGERQLGVEELGELPEDPLWSVLRAAMRAVPRARSETLPHATDRALIDGAHELGVHRREDEDGFVQISELPFEPARGFHAVHGELRDDAGEQLIVIKGAPERVLLRCTARRPPSQSSEGPELTKGAIPLDDAAREALVRSSVEIAARGLRVLALAERPIEARERIADRHVVDLCFVGFVAFADPVRDTAKRSVELLRQAGVDVVMITGDHPSTARAIAEELGLVGAASGSPASEVMTGAEVEDLSDEALDARIEDVAVFARATPSQKVRIVQSLQRCGRVVAMTGDGANDAPAIRLAEVGIALGERATPAARKVADIVVTDGRIETIVDAVFEGRALWRSVRDAVALLVGGNLGEIAFTVLGGLSQGRSPLNARQLLLVNLLTDALPALAIALRQPEEAREDPQALLREGPEASLGEALDRDIVWRALLTSSATTVAYVLARLTGTRKRADTVALLTLVGSQLGQTLALGRRDPTVLAAGLGSTAVLLAVIETPVINRFFGSRFLGPVALSLAFGSSLAATGAAVIAPKLGPQVRAWANDVLARLSTHDEDEDEQGFATPWAASRAWPPSR
jgi:cation-transporting ATPase I